MVNSKRQLNKVHNIINMAQLNYRVYRYNRIGITGVNKILCDNQQLSFKKLIDIVSIAYNNENVISHQIRLIKKYLQDPFLFTVADNSSDTTKQELILQICQEQGISYIRLPPNPFNGISGSSSQGLAMNWLYKHYVSSRNACFIGFIDHDIYPIRSTTLIDKLEDHKVFGHIQTRENRWYLWSGFCFFEQNSLSGWKPNFLPENGLDVGGGNWKELYSKLDMTKLFLPHHEYGYLRDGFDPQADLYEMIGDWLHTFNASYWKSVPSKENLIGELLSKY